MQLAVMGAAERYREFIAHFAAKGLRLGKSQVMGIRGSAAAEQARL